MGIFMQRVYDDKKNVFDASIERLDYIFENFERIYLSFSGGKDSGVMLNLTLDYLRERGITKKIGLMTMDNEANFTHSLEFMHKIIKDNLDLLDVYWCCLPITLPCTVSSYETTYITWGSDDKERWIRPMPKESYIVDVKKASELGMDFYEENMHDKDFYDSFSIWYAQGMTCANLIGIRTDESLNRFRAIMNGKKGMVDGKCWTRMNSEGCYNCYPVYDWRTEDVWVANAKFDWDYNELYDMFWKLDCLLLR